MTGELVSVSALQGHEFAAAEFLGLHAAGWCPRAVLPETFRAQRRRLTRSTRLGICTCGSAPYFLKAVARTAESDKRWHALPETCARNRILHESPLLLSPHLHVLTSTEWIRVYPAWPTDLSHYLQHERGGTLSIETAFEIMGQIAEGLAILEAHGLLHRDLKASNVLLHPSWAGAVDPRIVLADFSDENTCGTEYWSAPELVANRPTMVSPLFSLGIMAWRLLSRLAFAKFLEQCPLYRKGTKWPENARWFLSHEYQFILEQAARVSERTWRDAGGGPRRQELLSFVSAACVYEEVPRREELVRLLGPDAASRPARAAARWFEDRASRRDSQVRAGQEVPGRCRLPLYDKRQPQVVVA